MTYDVLSIGSALVDIFIHAGDLTTKDENLLLPLGDKIELDTFKIYSGGGASNTSVGFSRLGLRAAIIAETGQDNFSHIVMGELQKEGVATQLIIHEKKENTGGSVILVGDNGSRTVLVHRGAASQLDPFDIPTYWISKTKWIHLSSIAGQIDTIRKIFETIQKHPETELSWNPGSAELKLLADKTLSVEEISCRVLFLNKSEWNKIKNIHKEILAQIPQIIITDGGNGGEIYLEGKHSLHYDSQHIPSLDDTGAGDAFATGYVAAQILHKPPTESVKWGVRNATSVLRFHGAKTGLLRMRDIKEIND